MTVISLSPEFNQQWEARKSNEQKMRRNDHRSAYQRDRARILHSAAFRRLQAKTQVHGAGHHDFYRTRLTHSLEASQIGTGIVAQLKIKQPEFRDLLPSNSLMESLCLAHDIGHPPFGHGGEVALNYMMREHGGFEGNAQTFQYSYLARTLYRALRDEPVAPYPARVAEISCADQQYPGHRTSRAEVQ